jgi:hypothetical protein
LENSELEAALSLNGRIECVYLSSDPSDPSIVCADGIKFYPRYRQTITLMSDGTTEVGKPEALRAACPT